MRRLLHASPASLLRSPDLPFLLLWAASILAGCLVYNDFGLTWDEPLFYQYSDAVGYAYSIPEWLSGTFNLENAYGPSADHKIYGAAYLLVGRNVTRALQALTGINDPGIWHLTNFLAFEIGVLYLYRLCRRWMSPPAATAAALLYLTQPLLWGHAFINPKDMPFATLFILTVYAGFHMVDQCIELGVEAPATQQPEAAQQRIVRLSTRRAAALGAAAGVLALLLAGYGEPWRTALGDLVRLGYYAPPGSTVGRWFASLASSRALFPVDYYLAKVFSAYRWVNAAVALAALGFIGVVLARRFPVQAQAVRRFLLEVFSPPPRWPVLSLPRSGLRGTLQAVLWPAVLLGMLTAVRVLGPLAAVIVFLAFMLQPRQRSVLPLLFYVSLAALVTLACWPYVWAEPLTRFGEVVRHMADNPKLIPVLYAGQVFSSNALPSDYLPRLLGLTLTEPVWPLALAGAAVGAVRFVRRQVDWRTWIPITAWFIVPALYVVTQRPAMYDGYRHFLFILPPVFITCGLALDALMARLRLPAAQAVAGTLIVLPGILGIAGLHPYPYAYYNVFAGGVQGAFRRYETDYWLTCYKETVEALEAQGLDTETLFVHRQPAIARAYAGAQLRIEPFDPDADQTTPGSLLLLTTRSNSDQAIHPADPIILAVGRQGATFCVVKRVPSN